MVQKSFCRRAFTQKHYVLLGKDRSCEIDIAGSVRRNETLLIDINYEKDTADLVSPL